MEVLCITMFNSNKHINIRIVSIDGNIGSGKSTLLNNAMTHFKLNKNIKFLTEPIDLWNEIKDENNVTILKKFYENQSKYAFSFQIMAYISRLSVLRKCVNDIYNNANSIDDTNYIIITERSLLTDRHIFAKMLYDQNKIEIINYVIYLKWFDEFINEYPIDKIIYINTSPTICHERICKRSREGEDVIAIEYLNECHKYHTEFIYNQASKHEIVELNGNEDLFVNNEILKSWLELIELFILHKS